MDCSAVLAIKARERGGAAGGQPSGSSSGDSALSQSQGQVESRNGLIAQFEHIIDGS